MDKQELARRLARRSRQSQGAAADKLDALIYKLWRESREPKPEPKKGASRVASLAPANKP